MRIQKRKYILGWNQHTTSTTEALTDMCQSPIKLATGGKYAPADAKEFLFCFLEG